MLRIGLTGGIAAGKSVVARRLEELGAVLVDADVLARHAVEPGSEGLGEVVDAFGRGILTEDGALDRPALGRVIFGDAEARERLNAIVHPRVRSAAAALIAAAPADAVVVEDIPLLVETGQAARFHLVIVVDAPEAERIRRMVEHRGMDVREAERRIAAQVAGPERLRDADAVLTNTGTAEVLLGAVDALWRRRLLPFAANLSARRPSPRVERAVEDERAMALRGTVDLTRRVSARIEAALPGSVTASLEPLLGDRDDGVTSTGLRMTISGADASGGNSHGVEVRVREALIEVGFPQVSQESPELHRGADPATSVSIEVAAAPAAP